MNLQLQPCPVFETEFKIFLFCNEMKDEMLAIKL